MAGFHIVAAEGLAQLPPPKTVIRKPADALAVPDGFGRCHMFGISVSSAM
jgi:hypothetical protein